jgi:hypothetical protein
LLREVNPDIDQILLHAGTMTEPELLSFINIIGNACKSNEKNIKDLLTCGLIAQDEAQGESWQDHGVDVEEEVDKPLYVHYVKKGLVFLLI